MPTEAEMRFFGLLVLKKRISKEDVRRCLKAAELLAAKGQSLGLEEIAVRLKVITKEQIDNYKRSGCEDVPEMPGYTLLEKIGEGGTSNVFMYVEEKSGKRQAVKVLKQDQAEIEHVRRSFVREAKLLSKLEHENIVKGFRVGTVKGRYVFFMEHIEGDDLQDLLRKGMTFNEDAALYIVLQAARAMEYMRSRNILHRDIKPGNIMLEKNNAVKLIDLGFAIAVGGDGKPTDSTLGTVQYISPEQARGQMDLDVRSDIYSLGATLYQLVVGDLPFSGTDDQEIMAKQILDSLSSPTLKDRGKISPHMHYFIEKMMAKEREIRYQDPLELIEHIEDTIRGKKTLTFRPNAEGVHEGGYIDAPYASSTDGLSGGKEGDVKEGHGKRGEKKRGSRKKGSGRKGRR